MWENALKAFNELIALVSGRDKEWNDKLNRIVSKSNDKIDELEGWKPTVFKQFPIQPNLFRNSKNWFWTGKERNTFYDNVLPDGWSWYNHNDGDASFRAMVINAIDTAKLDELGIPHPEGNIPLVAEYGNDVAILYLEIQRTKGATVILAQDCARYTAWNKGNFVVGARGYWCVVDATGDMGIDIANRFPSIGARATDKGKGWIKSVNHRTGFGGCQQGKLHGYGTLKVAIALPYSYVGYLDPSIDAWAGFIGKSRVEYTHGDVDILA